MPSSRPASLNPRFDDALALLQAPRRAPLVMGIVNATPDSFYEGSRAPSPKAAVERGLALAAEGADFIDVGGQSTRPGSEPVSEAEELRRVTPVVEALAAAGLKVSIDTDKAAVARRALDAGARVLNDVTALRGDPEMTEAAKGFSAVILMHMGGQSPKTMQEAPRYGDVVSEVKEFLLERKAEFARAGGDPERLLFDPGIGFGKDVKHNLSLLKHVAQFAALAPVVLGVSRKSFLGRILDGEPPEDRLEGSLAAACWAAVNGVKVLRVHDVRATRRALRVLEAIEGAS